MKMAVKTVASTRLTKQRFERIFDDSISIKEYRELSDKIAQRFKYIVKKIFKKFEITIFDFGWNRIFSSEIGTSDKNLISQFHPRFLENEYVRYWSSYAFSYNSGSLSPAIPIAVINRKKVNLSECFPQRWFFEDFEQELDFYVKEKLKKDEEDDKKRKAISIKKNSLRNQVLSKLTKKEKRALGFS